MPHHRLAALAFVAIAFLSFSSTASAATLTISSGGELLGAQNVQVGGVSFDVTFVDGSCIGLFNGCREGAFYFDTTFQFAPLASQALLDQVFIGDFDSDPTRTFGCEVAVCEVLTPFQTIGFRPFEPLVGAVDYSAAINAALALPDTIGGGTLPGTFDTTGISGSGFVYARWSPAAPAPPSTVPEPSSLALMGIGAIGLISRRFRN